MHLSEEKKIRRIQRKLKNIKTMKKKSLSKNNNNNNPFYANKMFILLYAYNKVETIINLSSGHIIKVYCL